MAKNLFDLESKFESYFKKPVGYDAYLESKNGDMSSVFADAKQTKNMRVQEMARLALIRVCKSRLFSVFWKNFIGENLSGKGRAIRINNGDFEVFCGIVYESLDNGEAKGNALASFKPEAYKTNLVGGWQYWLGNFVKGNSEKWNRENMIQGNGNAKSISIEDVQAAESDKAGSQSAWDKLSYENGIYEEIDTDLASFDSDFTYALNDTVEDFDGDYPVRDIIYSVFASENANRFKDAQEEFSVSRGTIDKILKDFAYNLTEYGISRDDFQRMLTKDLVQVLNLIKK